MRRNGLIMSLRTRVCFSVNVVIKFTFQNARRKPKMDATNCFKYTASPLPTTILKTFSGLNKLNIYQLKLF